MPLYSTWVLSEKTENHAVLGGEVEDKVPAGKQQHEEERVGHPLLGKVPIELPILDSAQRRVRGVFGRFQNEKGSHREKQQEPDQ